MLHTGDRIVCRASGTRGTHFGNRKGGVVRVRWDDHDRGDNGWDIVPRDSIRGFRSKGSSKGGDEASA